MVPMTDWLNANFGDVNKVADLALEIQIGDLPSCISSFVGSCVFLAGN
jgi:hypothetical protein